MAGLKRNQKGFTLMEVMVSIALIGMLFTPMLAFFSHSTQTNIRVKNIQRANTAAQAVMEEFRSYATIQDIASTYGANTGSDDKMYMTYSDYNKSNGPTQIIDANGDFIAKDDKYYFVKEGIESDGKEYVARVEIDTTPYKLLTNVNDRSMPVISSLGSETTVVAKEDDETMDKIREYKKLYFNKTGINLDEDYFAERLLKTMRVVISDTITTVDEHGNSTTEPVASDMVHVRVYSEYALTETVDGCENAQVGSDIYNGLMEESRLQGIYVFFNFDVTNNGARKIMTDLEVSVDYHQQHDNWKCGYTVYAVCQSIYKVDEDVKLTGTDMEDYVNHNSPKINIKSKSFVNGVTHEDSPESGMTAGIWTNFPCNSTHDKYSSQSMETIVGTENIQRLSALTVQIFNKDDFTKPVATLISTRGE